MKEVNVTLKESISDPDGCPNTRISFSDRRGDIIPSGHTITGTVVHLSDRKYEYNSALRIVKIRTDIGIDLELLILDSSTQSITEEDP